jgi:hypothetical protein
MDLTRISPDIGGPVLRYFICPQLSSDGLRDGLAGARGIPANSLRIHDDSTTFV